MQTARGSASDRDLTGRGPLAGFRRTTSASDSWAVWGPDSRGQKPDFSAPRPGKSLYHFRSPVCAAIALPAFVAFSIRWPPVPTADSRFSFCRSTCTRPPAACTAKFRIRPLQLAPGQHCVICRGQRPNHPSQRRHRRPTPPLQPHPHQRKPLLLQRTASRQDAENPRRWRTPRTVLILNPDRAVHQR